jgi:DNA-binding response OmpR family regulator
MIDKIQLLHVSDDARYSDIVRNILTTRGFDVERLPGAREVIDKRERLPADMLFVDLEAARAGLARFITVLRSRNPRVPVIAHGPASPVEMEIHALESGADDYIREDATPALLVARLLAIHRRATRHRACSMHRLSRLTIFNSADGCLQVGDTVIRLSSTPALLLTLLCLRLNELSSMEYLVHGLWGKAITNKEKVLRKYLTSLRRVLSPDTRITILNHYGKGYTLVSRS